MSDDWRQILEPYVVTQEQVQRIDDSTPLFGGIIHSGQSTVWVAKPNSGKTALAMFAAKEMAAAGLEVFYFQLDVSGSGLKHSYERAQKNNYRLCAGLSEGASDAKIKDALITACSSGDHSNTVFILDTLKKFTDVNSKKEAPVFYSHIRGFTRKGGTALMLAHANKYNNADGGLVFDGVQDLVNDADNVAILEVFHTPDVLEITTNHSPDVGGKSRANIVEATFQLDKHRYEIKPLKGMSLEEKLSRDEQELKDEPIIKAIKELLVRGNPVNQSVLTRSLQLCGISQRSARRVLLNDEYYDYHWRVERGPNNSCLYTAIPLKAVKTVKTDVNNISF